MSTSEPPHIQIVQIDHPRAHCVGVLTSSRVKKCTRCPGSNRRFKGDLLFFWCEAAAAGKGREGKGREGKGREGKEKVGLDVSSPSHLPKSKNSLAIRRKSRFSPKLTKIASHE